MDFLGTESPQSVISSVFNGSQITGDALWPFFILLGVFIGFFIALKLIDFIKKSINDDSKKVLGFYIRKLPYKGYHRFRSEKWNKINAK